jgi:hypothetical protein
MSMSKLGRVACATVSLAFLALGCSNDDSGGGRAGRGSAACQAWQQALCNYAARDCRVLDYDECSSDYAGVTCASDTLASSCTKALDSASCSNPPSGCDLSDIADPAPAVTACNEFISALCKRELECSGTTLLECQASLSSQLDCSLAIAYSLSYEACLSDVAAASCSTSSLPISCQDTILIYTSSATGA